MEDFSEVIVMLFDYSEACRLLAQLANCDCADMKWKFSHGLLSQFPEPEKQLCRLLLTQTIGKRIVSAGGLSEENLREIIKDQHGYLHYLDRTQIIDLEVRDMLCPICGQEGDCEHHGDVSSSSQYSDEYVFVCANCGYRKTKWVDGGDSSWMNWFTNCPFCCEGKPETREI